MSGNRQYGITAGSRVGGNVIPVSPISVEYNDRDPSRYPVSRQSVSPVDRQAPPPPPPHRSSGLQSSQRPESYNLGYHQTMDFSHSRNERVPELVSSSYMATQEPEEGGMHALRDIDNLYGGRMMSPSPSPPPVAPSTRNHQHSYSQTSVTPLVAHQQSPPRSTHSPPKPLRYAAAAAVPTLAATSANNFDHSMPRGSYYHGDGYDDFDPRDFADDDEDVFADQPTSHQRPVASGENAPVATTVGAGAGGGFFKAFGTRDASGTYHAVGGVTNGTPEVIRDAEKSAWLEQQTSGRKRMKWIVGTIVALVLIAAIVGGVVGGVLASKKSGDNNGSSSSSSSSPASSSKGLYDINSPQVKQLLNNKNLHVVFPGMDYTPLNAQYPDCLTDPPDQNNVTLDLAMMAQLTPAVRLYGTDCNQTELVLTAIDRLGYNDTLKVWLGVWLGNNQTTNDRQLDQMYDILDKYPSNHFAGVIVGNEVLFRKDLTPQELGDALSGVRQNLTAKGISIPVSTSDLGDNWTAELAAESDIIMANVHPFFAGVVPEAAAGWTWNFWQTHDAQFTPANTGKYPKSIVSETGWPSTGGNDCGTDSGTCPSSTAGAVASTDNMNTFMADYVCQSLANGTTYFWFEAFDEPWKVQFNTDNDHWEPHWGLMDVDRNLKDGLQIPDCGGKTATMPAW